MLVASGGKLLPVVTGLIYCSVIAACQPGLRARSCARVDRGARQLVRRSQPQLVPFAGACLVHRAEIMQFGGAWPDAIEEARARGASAARASPDGADRRDALPAGGDPPAARRVRRGRGCLPRRQPGRAATRSLGSRCCASRRGAATSAASACGACSARDERAARSARGSCRPTSRSCWRPASSERPRGLRGARSRSPLRIGTEVLTRDGRACARRRRACARATRRRRSSRCAARSRVWQRVGAPYLAARMRVLLAQACRASATRTARSSSSTRRARSSSGSALRPTWPRCDALPASRPRRAAPTPHMV